MYMIVYVIFNLINIKKYIVLMKKVLYFINFLIFINIMNILGLKNINDYFY